MSLSTSSIGSPSQRGITIIGAGIAGLTLANLLQKSNIKFSIYEARSANAIGHSYAITLSRRPWRNIVNRLSEKHSDFRQVTAADHLVGGVGKVFDQSSESSATFQAIDRDVRQWLVQRLQEKGVEINWEHKLSGIFKGSEEDAASLSFEGKQAVQANIIVDAGGLRSPAFDDQIESVSQPKLLPYATYYGSRRISEDEFSNRFSHYFRSGNAIEFVPNDTETPFIQIKKVHTSGSDSSDHIVELRWVYSRPAKQGTDSLYRPDRTPQEAKIIPDELYEELQSAINEKFPKKQRSMLRAFFDSSDLHNDRILNWHLRIRLPPSQYFIDNSTYGPYQIIAIGDAAHGLPIVESRGAGNAAQDASNLVRWLERSQSDGSKFAHDSNYYKQPSIYRDWFKSAVQAIQRLRKCHGQSVMTRAELQDTLGFWVEGIDVESLENDEPSSSSEAEAKSGDKGRL